MPEGIVRHPANLLAVDKENHVAAFGFYAQRVGLIEPLLDSRRLNHPSPISGSLLLPRHCDTGRSAISIAADFEEVKIIVLIIQAKQHPIAVDHPSEINAQNAIEFLNGVGVLPCHDFPTVTFPYAVCATTTGQK
ncbi:MAG: hypothetical protein H6661_09465 [Ardenticatenaceae bacterium]|nr:hypothetical protein [Ardenticatenaceae bacterium]